jgi:prepilin-type N-terminal cleavage/methylation domain-containing protein/prepilin-type processing-associated H-X9-DG protein
MELSNRQSSKGRSRGFTVIEMLVAIGIIGLLMAILLPAMEHVRHQAYIDKCASNLRQIGLSLQTYANENHGFYPRTPYSGNPAGYMLNEGTGVNAPSPFLPGAGGVQINDLTAPVFLLMKSQGLVPEIMICPYNDDTSYEADSPNLDGRSNFTDQKKNLGYSFANPYPLDAVTHAGYRLTTTLSAEFAVAADRNPGVGVNGSNVYAPAPNGGSPQIALANSANHERDGQNVLYGDGHVQWQQTPFCGVGNDNIYTSKIGVAPTVECSPADPSDSVLLPTAQ